MYCRNCGKQLPNNSSFCMYCGCPTAFTQQNTQNNANDAQSNETTQNNTYTQNNQNTNYQPASNPNAKSKIAAGLLGIFLGGLGIHNFYLGFNSKAIIQLVLFVIGIATCWILIGIPLLLVTCIWGFVEGIILLAGGASCDANGNPLDS